MKTIIYALTGALLLGSCATVPAGYRGVKVYLAGRKNGSELKLLNTGRYYMGPYTKLYIYPTFQQDFTWTRDMNSSGGRVEPFQFQSKEGINVSVDIGISFHIVPDSVKSVFLKWRKDIDYIANVYFDDLIHDAIIHVGSTMSIEDIYGPKKREVLERVHSIVHDQVMTYGISVDRIFYVSDIKLPDVIVRAINQKIEATQIAQQRENELREVEANANKKIAEAKGESESKMIREKNQNDIDILNAQAQAQITKLQSEADANATITHAKAQSEANRMLQTTMTDKVLESRRIEKWDGKLPVYNGSSSSNITLPR
jgi:regulator of protease activity HflC (stomatin/prohibitin superfamily)